MNFRIVPLIAVGLASTALYIYKTFTERTNPVLIKDPFPFGVSELNNQFSIRVPLSDKALYEEYELLFNDLGIKHTGIVWEDYIINILERINPELLNHIEFDAEENGFYAYAATRNHQIEFVNTLTPIFRDKEILARYLVMQNKNRSYN